MLRKDFYQINFPRLPVRAFINYGDKSDFLSRSRIVAIREFAPRNIVYYEGNKFQINRTKIPIRGLNFEQIAICAKCGYFHKGDTSHRDTCENCNTRLVADAAGNPAYLPKVLPMDTVFTQRRERITCDEEERLKYGYNITTHFRYTKKEPDLAEAIANDGTELLKLTLGEADCKPDFIYNDAKIALFCDGSVHDHPEQSQQDQINRADLEFTTGYTVMVIRYDDSLEAKLNELASQI